MLVIYLLKLYDIYLKQSRSLPKAALSFWGKPFDICAKILIRPQLKEDGILCFFSGPARRLLISDL